MKSNPLNNKYSIYYLLYEYTQFYIYWLIIARVSFEKLVLLKIRLIIKLFPFEPLLAGIGDCMHCVSPSSKNNGLVSHATFSPYRQLQNCISLVLIYWDGKPENYISAATLWHRSHKTCDKLTFDQSLNCTLYFLEIKRVKIRSNVRSFTFYDPGPGPTTAILPLPRVKKC